MFKLEVFVLESKPIFKLTRVYESNIKFGMHVTNIENT